MRAGAFIQQRYPGYFLLDITTEYIPVFRRRGQPICAIRGQPDGQSASVPIDELVTREMANQIRHIAPFRPGTWNTFVRFPENPL